MMINNVDNNYDDDDDYDDYVKILKRKVMIMIKLIVDSIVISNYIIILIKNIYFFTAISL